jgi:formylglycine-generating enzyme required for sulfatase activity
MIGNVWEWVEETINDGMLGDFEFPNSGYVTAFDANGFAVEIDDKEPDDNYASDYLWISKNGVRGISRGGYWNNKSDGGVYASYMVAPPSFIGTGVGFRCVK